jgi:hypothetical protein
MAKINKPTFEHLNPSIYIFMQGHSEFGMTGNASLKIGMCPID